jgi:uncharacterized membrane protein
MKPFIIITTLIFMLLSTATPVLAQTSPIVQAVFFFNPDCDNCHQVITKDLPPLQAQYGARLEILNIDTSQPEGLQLYQAMYRHFQLPNDRLGTPAIVIGTTVLVGADEIPAKLSGLIETSLANGGVSWPEIPGLDTFVATAQKSTPYPGPIVYHQVYPQPIGQSSEIFPSGDPSTWERFSSNFQKDPLANGLAVVVLVGMMISFLVVLIHLIRSVLSEVPSRLSIRLPGWLIPVLLVIGLGIAVYLTFIEVGKKPAICGPLGNCNQVQTSKYAKLFGFLPIGVLGLVGYATLLVAWGVQKLGPKGLRNFSTIALWGMSLFGVAFSIYLTFLEPFVIGATCMWCISSALVMTALLWLTTPGLQETLIADDIADEDEPE